MASRGTSDGRKVPQTFTWTLENGDSLRVQHRGVSIVDTQEKYSFTMGYFKEYRRQRENHQGKDWVHTTVLPEWASKYGIPAIVEKEVRDGSNEGDDEEGLRKKMLFNLGEVCSHCDCSTRA